MTEPIDLAIHSYMFSCFPCGIGLFIGISSLIGRENSGPMVVVSLRRVLFHTERPTGDMCLCYFLGFFFQ